MRRIACRRVGLLVIGLLLMQLFGSFLTVSRLDLFSFCYQTKQETEYIPSQYLTTRRQAIIDYLQALQAPEGYFHAFLKDPPPFDPARTAPDAQITGHAISVMNYTNTTNEFDLKNTKSFISSLHDSDSNLPNSSKFTGPSIFSINNALKIYPILQLDSLITKPAIDSMTDFIISCQRNDGGFVGFPMLTRSTLVETFFALESLQTLNNLASINLSSDRNFVLSCMKSNGGFSNTPESAESTDYVVLGLKCMKILDLNEHINATLFAEYLLKHWNPNLGCANDEHLQTTERIVWALYELNKLNFVDKKAVCDWVLNLQNHNRGEFVPSVDASVDDERLVWCKSATHILEILSAIELLDEEFSVVTHPEWEVPEWWEEWVSEHYGTQTATAGPDHNWILPDFSFLRYFFEFSVLLPILGVFVLLSPMFLMFHKKRGIRKNRRLIKERRKKRIRRSTG